MANWLNFRRKATDAEIAATVPLVNDLSSVTYPEDNYQNFAVQGYNRSSIVNACIRELSTGAASARYYAQADTADGMVEVENSRLTQLLYRPNPDQDFYSWIERLVTYLYVSGNVYVLKERARDNSVVAMYLLRPDRMAVVPSGEGVSGYSYTIDGKEYFLDKEDVGHLKFPNPANDTYGLSPLHVLAKTVNLDMSMTDFAKVYFQNAGVPSGLLKIKRRLTSQQEADRLRSRWRSSFGGTNNFHKVAVLDDDAEYQQMASSPSDMALTELHNHTESRICSVLGVPPILISANVGLARSTFANYREARFSFHSETLEPLINRIVRFLNYCLYSELDRDEIAVDYSEMRGFLDDKESINARASSLFGSGIITLNEAREMVGQDALPEGEVRRLPANIVESTTPAVGQVLTEGFSGVLSASKTDPVTPRGRKMGEDLNKSRDQLTDKWEPKFDAYFKKLKNRVDGILGRYLSRNSELEKVERYPFSFSTLVPESEVGDLAEIFFQMFTEISKETYGIIDDAGVAGKVTWSEAAPTVSNLLTQAPVRAKLVHSTTQKIVQKALETGFSRGYSVEMLARGVPADNFAGLQATMNETRKRARLIARTEVMRSQNLTSVGLFKNQGFEYVRAYDVDGDPNDNYVPVGDPYGRTCIQRDGQVYSVEDAGNIEDHPNGTLSWVPMPRNYVHEGAVI